MTARMISPPDFLQAQLDLYSEQSGELEPWMMPRADAAACRSLAQVIDFGLALLARIQKENDRWAADIEAGMVAFSWEASEAFAQRYRQWREMSDRILRAVKKCEDSDCLIERSAELMDACHKVSLMALDTERSRRSIESLEAGRGIRHAEAIDELRTRVTTNADTVLSAALEQDGSVTGVIEKINVHNRCEFVLYPPIPGHSITCLFPESMLPQVREAIKRNVTVHGSMNYYAAQPFPRLVRVTSLDIHPCDDKLPLLADLRGMAPGCTGGLSAVDFVRSLQHD